MWTDFSKRDTIIRTKELTCACFREHQGCSLWKRVEYYCLLMSLLSTDVLIFTRGKRIPFDNIFISFNKFFFNGTVYCTFQGKFEICPEKRLEIEISAFFHESGTKREVQKLRHDTLEFLSGSVSKMYNTRGVI